MPLNSRVFTSEHKGLERKEIKMNRNGRKETTFVIRGHCQETKDYILRPLDPDEPREIYEKNI